MTVYAKIEDNKLITAYNGYNGVIGMADSPELCLANGFTAYTEEEVSGYFTGTHIIIEGVLTDISNDPRYIEQQRKIKETKLFNEARECVEKLLTYKLLYPVQAQVYQDAIDARYSQLDTQLAELDGE
jgi:hypothetical protein